MSVAIQVFPYPVQDLYQEVCQYQGTDIWNDLVNPKLCDRARQLTATFCSAETIDFIMLDLNHAFLFTNNETVNTWKVEHAGIPTILIDSEIVGVDPDQMPAIVKLLEFELSGVDVRYDERVSPLRDRTFEHFFEFKIKDAWSDVFDQLEL